MQHPFDPFLCEMPHPDEDLRRLQAGFETYREAEEEREFRIQALLRAASKKAICVADALAACASNRRCLRPSCPVCMGRFRLWLGEQQLKLWPDDSDLRFWTLIPVSLAVGVDGLAQISPKQLRDMLRQQLSRAGVNGPVTGGIDGEYDQERDVWQPHFHLIAPAASDAKIQGMVKRAYPPAPGIYRPVVRLPVNDRPALFSYCLKSYWPERVRFNADKGGRRSRHRRLQEGRHVAWLIWRHEFSLADFLFLSGVRRRGCHLLVGNRPTDTE